MANLNLGMVKQKEFLKKIIGEHLCDHAVGRLQVHCTKSHKVENIHNTQILISDKEPIFRLYKALLLIKKTKTAKPTEKWGKDKTAKWPINI